MMEISPYATVLVLGIFAMGFADAAHYFLFSGPEFLRRSVI